MPLGPQQLTEKEKQTLRLIVRGHDAKSVARTLGLSVHTINERLRDARRKLQVSSSREAARLLFESESAAPQKTADKEFGEAGPSRSNDRDHSRPELAQARRLRGALAGVTIMLIIIGAAALAVITGQTSPANGNEPPLPQAVAETEAVAAAREWLELGDQGRWNEGWRATAEAFRKANSAARWADAATRARTPLGALVSRTALQSISVPTPPAGGEVVKFRSSFANRAEVVETVSLVREGGRLKVTGIYME